MNVRGDRARNKFKAGLIEGTGNAAGIPSIIKSAVTHWKRIRKNRGQIIKHHRHAVLVTLIDNRAHPGVADFLAATGFMGGRPGWRSPIAVFFRLERVHNHSSDCRARWSIEPGNEEQRCRSYLGNGTESLKIRIRNHTRD